MSFSRAKLMRFNEVKPDGDRKGSGSRPTSEVGSIASKNSLGSRSFVRSPVSGRTKSRDSIRSRSLDERHTSETEFLALETLVNSVTLDDSPRRNPSDISTVAAPNKAKMEVNPKPSTAPSPSVTLRKTPLKRDAADSKTSSGIPVFTPKNIVRSPSRIESPRTPLTKAPVSRTSAISAPGLRAQLKSPSPEVTFIKKKKMYATLKKELTEKQSVVLQTYKSLVTLKNQIFEKTGKSVQLETVKLIDYNDKPEPEEKKEAQQQPPLPSTSQILEAKKKNEETMQNMQEKLSKVPNSCFQLCRIILEQRKSILDWLAGKNLAVDEDEAFKQQLEVFREETDKLTEAFSTSFAQHDAEMKDLLQDWQGLYEKANAGTFEENAHLRQEIEEFREKLSNIESKQSQVLEKYKQQKECCEADMGKTINDLEEKIQELQLDLEMEKTKSELHKESVDKVDSHLKQYKGKYKDLETKRQEDYQKIEKLTSLIKKLEEQARTKENFYENRNKEFLRTKAVGDSLIDKMEKERQGFEMRIKVLEESLEKVQKERTEEAKNARLRVAEAERAVAEKEAQKEAAETKLEALKLKMLRLEVRSQSALNLARRSQDLGSFGEEFQTDTEIDLWTELQASKVALKAAEDNIVMLAGEKGRLLESLQLCVHKDGAEALAQRESEITEFKKSIQKLENDILAKEDELQETKSQIIDRENRIQELHQEIIRNTNISIQIEEQENMENTEASRAVLDLEKQVLKLEHELNVQKRNTQEMENMIKARDELVAMMTEKKESAEFENIALKEYSNKINGQFKEVERSLTEKAQELQGCYKTLNKNTKYINSLEISLQNLRQQIQKSNQKRFELQENISKLVQELQVTRLKIEKMSDSHLRKSKPQRSQ